VRVVARVEAEQRDYAAARGLRELFEEWPRAHRAEEGRDDETVGREERDQPFGVAVVQARRYVRKVSRFDELILSGAAGLSARRRCRRDR
jgi:hypothetical protein